MSQISFLSAEEAETLAALPELGADEEFQFHCGADVPCFNHCCRDLTLPLPPYDILRMRYQLGIEAREILATFATLHSFPKTGLPIAFLRMIESPSRECPFSSPAGCSVYEDRPGACRSYPLGRGARMSREGLAERYFIIREECCQGFGHGIARTPKTWFAAQGMEKYNYFNDRYMKLNTMLEASGRPLAQKLAGLALVALYQLEQFRQLIARMRIFDHLDMPAKRQNLIMTASRRGDEACLDFAFDWLMLVIFGIPAPNLEDQEIG